MYRKLQIAVYYFESKIKQKQIINHYNYQKLKFVHS